MSQRTFSFLVGLVFLVVAVMHVLRLAFSWHVTVGGWTVPIWVSWVAFFVSGLLAYEGLKLSRLP